MGLTAAADDIEVVKKFRLVDLHFPKKVLYSG
jgi:hypothetical protein